MEGSQFPAQVPLRDSGHCVLLCPHLCPLECSCRVCVTVHWELTQHLCCLEGLQVSVPPSLSCGEQQGSAVLASEHSSGVKHTAQFSVRLWCSHGCFLEKGWLSSVIGSQSKQVLSASKILGHCLLS